jgi:hypothetical protein
VVYHQDNWRGVGKKSLPRRRMMLCLVRTKGCRRCGGDLSLECDIYGIYATCIQCGATWSKTEMVVPTAPKAPENMKTDKAKTLSGDSRQR